MAKNLIWNSDIKLRAWQQEHFDKWRVKMDKGWNSKNRTDRTFFSIAFPGSGKTFLMLSVAHNWLTDPRNNNPFVVFCVPSTRLVTQFYEDSEIFGLGIKANMKIRKNKGNIPSDENGAIYTYAGLRKRIDELRKICATRDVLMIADEPHHVGAHNTNGDVRAYGDWLMRSFEDARAVFLASGTPWRSDSHPIAFAAYKQIEDKHGRRQFELIWDAQYGYRDALIDTTNATTIAERICTQISFQWASGNVGFDYGLENYDEYLDEALAPELVSPALWTAYNPEVGTWFSDTFRDADDMLLSIRNDEDNPYPRAAGLIIAPSIQYAEHYADIVRDAIGERPLVIHSDLDMDEYADHYKKPNDLVSGFKDNHTTYPRWIISVAMISEGVDLPRLKVLLYASPIRQRLYFYQVVGRVIRWDKKGAEFQNAYVFAPKVEPFLTYAREIEDIVLDVMRDPGEGGDGPQPKLRVPIINDHEYGGAYDTDTKEAIDSKYLREAKLLRPKAKRSVLHEIAVALAMKDQIGGDDTGASDTVKPLSMKSKDANQKALNKSLRAFVYQRLKGYLGNEFETGKAFKATWQCIFDRCENKIENIDQMTNDELVMGRELIRTWTHEQPDAVIYKYRSWR